MENKVLIKLSILEWDESYDVFIPVNEIIWKVKKMLLKSVQDLSGKIIDKNTDYVLMNKDSLRVYNNNEIIINTDIRNGTELIVMFKNK